LKNTKNFGLTVRGFDRKVAGFYLRGLLADSGLRRAKRDETHLARNREAARPTPRAQASETNSSAGKTHAKITRRGVPRGLGLGGPLAGLGQRPACKARAFDLKDKARAFDLKDVEILKP